MENLDLNYEQRDYEYENGFHLQSNFDSAVNQVTQTIDNVIQAIDLGYINPLEAFAVFKELEKRFNEAKGPGTTISFTSFSCGC